MTKSNYNNKPILNNKYVITKEMTITIDKICFVCYTNKST